MDGREYPPSNGANTPLGPSLAKRLKSSYGTWFAKGSVARDEDVCFDRKILTWLINTNSYE